LTPAELIPDLVNVLASRPDAAMATAALHTNAGTYAHLARDAASGRVGGTTVVAAQDGRAIYFPSDCCPSFPPIMPRRMRRCCCIWAFTPIGPTRCAGTPPSLSRRWRRWRGWSNCALEGAAPIIVSRHPAPSWDCIELNNPQDVPEIEAILAHRGID
jgi:3-deoxy-manno-octulosonate cytidylyltransferase (CMP-KDO synthetase)